MSQWKTGAKVAKQLQASLYVCERVQDNNLPFPGVLDWWASAVPIFEEPTGRYFTPFCPAIPSPACLAPVLVGVNKNTSGFQPFCLESLRFTSAPNMQLDPSSRSPWVLTPWLTLSLAHLHVTAGHWPGGQLREDASCPSKAWLIAEKSAPLLTFECGLSITGQQDAPSPFSLQSPAFSVWWSVWFCSLTVWNIRSHFSCVLPSELSALLALHP